MAINSRHLLRSLAAGVCAAALALTAACGSGGDQSNDATAGSGDITQQTVTPGTLTIATGDPAYEPWVLDDNPESGKGYEAALAYAVAEKMGFDKDHVKWTSTSFDAAIAPGAKDWDMNIQQFGITPERKKAVDFSSSYYKDTRAVIVKKDGKYANATSLADLKGAVIGATVGTQGYTYAKQDITDDVQTFNDDASTAQALDAGQVDAIVADTTVCVYMVDSGQVKDAKVLGRIAGSEDKDGMGIVLPKGSPLTKATTKAVDELTADGTIEQLQKQWLADYTTNLPELK
ncbi:amino acid ABC transporter substrate-binding protein [Bifidobacterium pullorum subsp. saeculare]|uniref:Amino acid ABC transporter substrate-binding protein n=1 Tax=Bifidobacterium pullorum subsp. saeculare TaxID=78257 RepID=A0A938WXL7_9BIFI|nr:ABC transporter substrate-binding protein [Bifidobacterium pullorum]MBM6699766.1 amino acid ABC transporter substrate-binding protein [Bifidobacterium pullorum subsp. saeculare]